MLNMYTFTWSNRCSAGTIVILETSSDRAWEELARHFDPNDCHLELDEQAVPGAHVIVTTEQNTN